MTAHEVDDDIDGRHEDDEVAEGHDLLRGGHRDDVGEDHHQVVRLFELTSAGQLDVVLEAGIDDSGVHERFGPNRHALVEHDRDDVRAEADRHDAHAGQVQVRCGEPREQHE